MLIKVPGSDAEISAAVLQISAQPPNSEEELVRGVAEAVLKDFRARTVELSSVMREIGTRTIALCNSGQEALFSQVWKPLGSIVRQVLVRSFAISLEGIRLPDSVDDLRLSLEMGTQWHLVTTALREGGFPETDRVIAAAAKALSCFLGRTLSLERGAHEMKKAMTTLCPNTQFLAIVLPVLQDVIVQQYAVSVSAGTGAVSNVKDV